MTDYYCFPAEYKAKWFLMNGGFDIDMYLIVHITEEEVESQGVDRAGFYIWAKGPHKFLMGDYHITEKINQ